MQNVRPFNRRLSGFLAPAALGVSVLVLSACSQRPSPDADAGSSTRSGTQSSTSAQRAPAPIPAAPRDTVLRDTTRILGTPGSPTGAESRGMPGEKPIPGTKK
jgi:hypothetical protein